MLDLKAAVRYLRHFNKQILGDAEKIITDGTSAGGAMSALMGATGNVSDYASYLKSMGAADERDDVFASVCFCPITDLEHSDMAYEWLYGNTNSRQALSDSKRQLTKELTAQFPVYVNSLSLTKPDGTALTADNYLDYIGQLILEGAQEAKDAGATLPDTIGLSFSKQASFQAPINGGVGIPAMPRGNRVARQGEYVTGIDMQKYLNYVVTTQPLKGVPAFDSYGVDGADASGENGEFGNSAGSNANFTQWAADKSGSELTTAILLSKSQLQP